MMRLSRLAKERKQRKLDDGRMQELFEQSVAFRAGIRATIIQKNVLIHLCWKPGHVGFLTLEETAQTVMVCRRWWQAYYGAPDVRGPLAKGRYFNPPMEDNMTSWMRYLASWNVVYTINAVKGSITVSTSSTTEFEYIAKNNQWRFAVFGIPMRYVYYKSSGEFKDAFEQWLPTSEFRKHQAALRKQQQQDPSSFFNEIVAAEKHRLEEQDRKARERAILKASNEYFLRSDDSDLKEAIRRSLVEE
jgi:hypothetical protein